MSFHHLDDPEGFVPDDAFRAAAQREGRRRRARRRLALLTTSVAALVLVAGLAAAIAASSTNDRSLDIVGGGATTTVATSVSTTSTSTAPEPTSTMTTAPPPTSAPPDSPNPTVAQPAEPSPTPAVEVVELDASFTFTTPSRNIGCVMVDAEEVRCDIGLRDYVPTEVPPPDCIGDWGPSILMEGGAPARFRCTTDSMYNSGEVVSYGTELRLGDLSCTVIRAGVTCRSGAHGFSLSRQAYSLY